MYIKSAVAEKAPVHELFFSELWLKDEKAQEKNFFIRHGAENTLSKQTTLDAANRLMVRCFPTFWHRARMAFAMDFCARLAAEIECYEYGFVPDQSAVKYIKEFAGNGGLGNGG